MTMYTQLLFTAGWAERGSILDIVFFLLVFHLPMLIFYVPLHYLIKLKYLTLAFGKRIAISFITSLVLYYSLIGLFFLAVG